MKMNENKTPEMLTVKDTAKRFGLSEYFVRTKANEGAFPAVKSGKKVLVNAEGFSYYLSTNILVPVEPAPKSKAKPKEEKVLGISPIRE